MNQFPTQKSVKQSPSAQKSLASQLQNQQFSNQQLPNQQLQNPSLLDQQSAVASSSLIQVKELLDRAQTALVIINSDHKLDVLAASSALNLVLKAMGKDVVYATSELPDLSSQINSYLAGLELLKNDLSNKNMVISFNYDEKAVQKVSYHIGEEINRFYLTVSPQKGHAPLDTNTVELGYAGAEADIIFLIGVHDYETLDHLYSANEQLYNDSPVVVIHNFEPNIGQIKLNTHQSVGFCSYVAMMIQELNLPLPQEAATNLLFGIEELTSNFKSLSTTAQTLEIAAWLMRNGARRIRNIAVVESDLTTDSTSLDETDEMSIDKTKTKNEMVITVKNTKSTKKKSSADDQKLAAVFATKQGVSRS